MDAASITFALFTIFSSLRIISYVPQIRRVAIDNNGASAISYSTWALWTGANVATALYAAINLHEWYLSAVSSIYAICCMVVILFTILKRRRLAPAVINRHQAPPNLDSDRRAVVDALRLTVRDGATALAQNRRPHYAIEQALAVQARRIVWGDPKAALASASPISTSKALAMNIKLPGSNSAPPSALRERTRGSRCQSRTVMPAILLSLCIFALTAMAAAEDSTAAINRDLLLCQAGYVSRCDHLLRSPLDEQTRMLVRVDHQFARERVAAHVNLLAGICDGQSNVKACDRALSYNLSDSERKRVVDIRHSVLQRGSRTRD